MADRLYLSPPHMGGEEVKLVQEAIASNWIAPLGPMIDRLESALDDYLGLPHGHVVCLSSGTAALHLACEIVGLKRGTRAICSDLTFVASPNAIAYTGADISFVDSETSTWNMSPDALECALEQDKIGQANVKAVVLTHLYGNPAQLNRIIEMCKRYDVELIEDAAEALGAVYDGQKVGTFGRFGVFSFNGNKVITTGGGGALVCRDLDDANLARSLATQARVAGRRDHEHELVGYNYRMGNVVAAIGLGQMAVLDEWVRRRQAISSDYAEAFEAVNGLTMMPWPNGATRWFSVLKVDPAQFGKSSNQVMDQLESENIETRPPWRPMTMTRLYGGKRVWMWGARYVSKEIFAQGICLPSGSAMSDADRNRVIKAVLER